MLVRIEDKSGIEKQLFFSVTQSQVDESINSFIKEIAPRVEARGFRKGTAPPAVIRGYYFSRVLRENCS
jgi:FKBP-type peptidyl-prolyl cis-trans isomerase (trigger factor)